MGHTSELPVVLAASGEGHNAVGKWVGTAVQEALPWLAHPSQFQIPEPW